MKLNNKGFAITAVIYGLLILFVVLVSSYLLVLGAKKDRVDQLVNDVEEEYRTGKPLADYITELYNSSQKTIVKNNGISYNYASSVNLMNDRLGGTTSSYDAGNIRYYGANPNNYIYFNCSDYTNQSSETCEIWRIIGVFENKVKIIRNEPLGNYPWDFNYDFESNNNWNDATLNTLLNNAYYNSTSTTQYDWTNTDGIEISFASNGITKKTQQLISDTTWYLMANESGPYSLYSNTSYQSERNEITYNDNPETWYGKIALMYPSDYGYAVDFNDCPYAFQNYNLEECITKNWLYIETTEFTITPSSSDDIFIWVITYGWPDSGDADPSAEYNLSVRPTLYLKSEIAITGGKGTSANPYKIIID